MVNTLRPPPEVIASWPTPNYIDPEARGPGLIYCAVILASFGVLIVLARLYSRIFITKAPGVDDFLIVGAMLFGGALTVLVCIGNLRYHSGRHIWDTRPSTAADHRLNIWVSQWCYLTSTSLIKISVLLFYRRLSVTFSRGFWWATWIGIIYNVLQLIAFWCALLLLCRPVQAYWLSFDRTWALENQGNYYCSSEVISLTMSAVLSIIGDFCEWFSRTYVPQYTSLLLFPPPLSGSDLSCRLDQSLTDSNTDAAVLPSVLIMGLNLTPRKKVAVGALFAVGYIVVGLGIGRAIILNRVVMHDYDYTWLLWEMWVWSLCELWLGLLAASAPALKPFLKRFLVDPLSSAISTTARNSQGHRRGRSDQPANSTKRPVRSWNWLSPPLPQGGARSPAPPGIDAMVDNSGSSTDLKSSTVREHYTSYDSKAANNKNAPHDLEHGSVPMRAYSYNTRSIDSRIVEDAEWYAHGARCWSPASAPTQMEHHRHRQHRQYSSLDMRVDDATAGYRFSSPPPTSLVGVDGADVLVDAEDEPRGNRHRRWDWR